jgi:hypothetical protein
MFKRKGNIIYFKSTKKSIKKGLFTNYVIWKKNPPQNIFYENYICVKVLREKIYNQFIFSFKQKYEKDNNSERKIFSSKQHCWNVLSCKFQMYFQSN